MRTLLVTAGIFCLTFFLLGAGQQALFSVWSSRIWDKSSPVESMVFEEWLLYGLFPLAVVAGTLAAAILANRKPFLVSLLGILPVFVAVTLLRRDSPASVVVYLSSYALLCFAIVKVHRWLSESRRSDREDGIGS